MKIRNFVAPEQGPILTGFHSFHEQIWNPIGCIHVVSSATIITCVFPEFQELKNIAMP